MKPAASNHLIYKGRQGRSSLPAPLSIASGRHHTADTILRAWYASKTDHTIRAYGQDLEAFAQYFSQALAIRPSMRTLEALDRFFRQSSPSAHEIVLGFRDYLASAGLSSGTINRHLATLRSVSKLARMLGLTTWAIEVPGMKQERRRDTRGPRPEDVARMLAATSGDSQQATRDAAIVLVFYCMGLRVSELCGLTLQETNLDAGSTWILGKGRREREIVPIPALVCDALRRYLVHRGDHAGPLFQTLGSRGVNRDGGLETRSVLRIVRTLGSAVGVRVWCHGLRHSSITQAAEEGQKAGLGLDKIRAHSRHKNITTLMTYIDEHHRGETQKTLGELVAGTLTPASKF